MKTQILVGDVRKRLRELPDSSVQCCVTSPPYWGLRDYGHDGQIGLEQTPEAYVAEMVDVFREVRRVLRDDGTLWLNLGDSYARNGGGVESKMKTAHKMGVGQKAVYAAGGMQTIDKVPTGYKEKDLIGIPWRVAFALQADGWWLRQDIIWHKPNPMPESVRDRCTKAHEYVFLLTQSERYFYDAEAIHEEATGRTFGNIGARNTRNRRSVWTVTTKPYTGAHFAVMPPELAELCIKAGSAEGDTILDPFGGAGTTALVANRLRRDAIMCELNSDYADLAKQRIHGDAPMFNTVEAR